MDLIKKIPAQKGIKTLMVRMIPITTPLKKTLHKKGLRRFYLYFVNKLTELKKTLHKKGLRLGAVLQHYYPRLLKKTLHKKGLRPSFTGTSKISCIKKIPAQKGIKTHFGVLCLASR